MKRQTNINHENSFLLRLTKLLLFCVAIFILFVVIYVFCGLKTVIIEGSTKYSKEEAQELIITKKTDGNTFLFYLRSMYGEKESIPFVDDYDVKILDKNTVKIHIYEKAMIGCIKYMSSYMYFDKDGIIVESSNEKIADIPYIEGLKFSRFVLYRQLEVEKKELFDIILNLTQLIQKFELEVEKIQFNEKLEVTLVSGSNKVLLGKRETYDEQLAELMEILPKADNLIIDMKDYEEGQDKNIIGRPIEK
ncbi:MAG: cell division protein FtsQ/DivIB [Anaerocolumna sp.]